MGHKRTGHLPQISREIHPQETALWNEARAALDGVQDTCARAIRGILQDHTGINLKDLEDGTLIVGGTASNGSCLTYDAQKPKLILPTGSSMRWIYDPRADIYLPSCIASNDERKLQIQFRNGEWQLITRLPEGMALGEIVSEENLKKVQSLKGHYPLANLEAPRT